MAFSTFAVQRNRDLYGQDANKFRPERWEDDVIKQRRMVDWSYHPFFGGPRKCLGGKLIWEFGYHGPKLTNLDTIRTICSNTGQVYDLQNAAALQAHHPD